jgi:tetratricopeptide (TPR) repeat protein
LLAQGRDHITAGEYILAIQKLNRLLTLPRNKFTDDAIEYIGVARERGGQFELAREMYENYLRVNPDTEGAERVRQRLASMAGASAEPTPALRPAQDKVAPVKTVFGSLSQTYHRTESTTSATSTQPELFTDAQRILINYLDLNARYQGGDYDNRVVLRDQHTYNWLDTSQNEHRVTAAYLELKDKKRDYSARFGRQPGNTGGVLGIFDGASATYNISPSWHISGSTGVPKENKLDAQRYLYSVSTDFGPLAQHWYGGLYYVYQFVEGVEDRNAVGAEMRYFEPGHSVYTLFDYDLSYSALNIAVLQANWQTESNTSYNLLLDHRKSPALQASNVLNGASVLENPADPMNNTFIIPSYSLLSSRYTYAELREFARLHTPEANFYDFSVSRPVSPRLQLGGGINMYNFSESAETPIASFVPGTGNTFVYSLRAIGTGLVFDKDISILTLSHTSGDTLDGNGIVLSNKSIFKNKWTFDVDLRLSKQNSRFPETTTITPTGPLTTAATDTDNTLVSPTVRFGYRMKQTAVFEIEYGQDRTRSRDLININSEETVTKTMHYSVGYRWTF